MIRSCGTCHAPLVNGMDESNANFRKRKTCRTKECRAAHRLKAVNASNERKKQRKEMEGPERRKRFTGKVTKAMDDFLRGAR